LRGNDEYFRMLMKSFSALAFVPSQEVITTFESLADEMTENFGEEEAYNSFIDYSVMTWVGHQYPRSSHHPNPYNLVGGLVKEQVKVDFI
jgi:hypothetical protein